MFCIKLLLFLNTMYFTLNIFHFIKNLFETIKLYKVKTYVLYQITFGFKGKLLWLMCFSRNVIHPIKMGDFFILLKIYLKQLNYMSL